MAEILRDPPVKTFNFWHFKEDAKVLAFDAEGSKGLPRLIKVIKAEKTDALFPLGLVDMGYSDEDEDIVYGKTIGHVTFETEEAREAAYQSLISIKPSEGKAFEAACETLGEQLENPFDKYNMDEDIREANIYGLIADFDIKFEDAPEGEVDHVQALADGVIYRGGPFAPDARTPQMIAAHEAEGYGISMPPISLEEMVTEIVKPGRINHQSIEWNVKLHYADMETFSDEVRKEMDLDPRFDDRWAAYLKNDGEGNVFNWIVEDMREPYLSAPNTYNEVTVWASGPEHKDHLSVDFKFNGPACANLSAKKAGL